MSKDLLQRLEFVGAGKVSGNVGHKVSMKLRILSLAILASMGSCSREMAVEKKGMRAEKSFIERTASLNTNFVKILMLDEWTAHAQDYAKALAESCQKSKDSEFSLRSLEAGSATLIRFGPDRVLTEKQTLAIGAIVIQGMSVPDAEILMAKDDVGPGKLSTGELENLYELATEEYEKRGIKRKKDWAFEWNQ